MGFPETFATARPSNALYCHQEFLEKLVEHERDSIGRRTAFLMQRLSVDERRLHYKATSGVNWGWRRSRLGGNQGRHFYGWWAPKNALPVKDSGGFSSVTALAALRALPERQSKLEAVCYEGLGDLRSAAESHLATGNLKDALNCYRAIPDLEAALELIRQIGDHPAAESPQWISRLQQLVAERPEKFTKVVTAAEKKVLEDVLERSLGVARTKPAPRKTAAKTTAKKAPAPRKRTPRRSDFGSEFF
jgi:hypothetical protein